MKDMEFKKLELLKVQNNQIITASKSPIRLRGWNIGGWLNMEDFIDGFVGAEHNLRATMARVLGREKAQFFFDRLLDHFFTEDDIKAMAELGGGGWIAGSHGGRSGSHGGRGLGGWLDRREPWWTFPGPGGLRGRRRVRRFR